MQEQSRYAVGIDIGTKTVRCVVGHIDPTTGVPKIVGVGSASNSGMRKGIVSNLSGPAAAIDKALEVAERMSGHQVNEATLSINGSHILSTRADGMVAVSSHEGEVTHDDIVRLEEVATTGKVPANREILNLVPHAYRLDGQDNIKDPIGMTGTRLEIRANIVSGLVPHINNLRKSAEMANVAANSIVPSVLAGARAVLNESQIENGVAVIDLGGSTTSIAVYEEGDLQYVSVLPVGAQNATNDLAIGLKTDPEIAEVVKVTHAQLDEKASGKVEVEHEKKTYEFSQKDVHEAIGARYEEIFESIAKEIKEAGGVGRLPSGVVLVGGGAKIKGIVEFAKKQLGVAARLGKPTGYAGVSDEVKDPRYSAAIGLLLIDADGGFDDGASHGRPAGHGGGPAKSATSFLNKVFAKFK